MLTIVSMVIGWYDQGAVYVDAKHVHGIGGRPEVHVLRGSVG